MDAISVQNLTKTYGHEKGIFDLSFSVKQGEAFGYLGPNGAGKTTTLRHLMGFLTPDSGTCSIMGMDCRKEADKIQKVLGYLPGEISLMEEMTGTHFIKFMAGMRQLQDFKKTVELLKRFELHPEMKIRKMSKGNKQKVGLICAFMHDPSVLILDEPTSGLDPLMQNRFIELILEEKACGKTILMSSHVFEEVEKTCDRIGILKSGRLCTTQSVFDLKSAQVKQYQVFFESEDAAHQFSQENVEVVSSSRTMVTVAVRGDMTPFIWAMSKYTITGLHSVHQGLEDLFLQYYKT